MIERKSILLKVSPTKVTNVFKGFKLRILKKSEIETLSIFRIKHVIKGFLQILFDKFCENVEKYPKK